MKLFDLFCEQQTPIVANPPMQKVYISLHLDLSSQNLLYKMAKQLDILTKIELATHFKRNPKLVDIYKLELRNQDLYHASIATINAPVEPNYQIIDQEFVKDWGLNLSLVNNTQTAGLDTKPLSLRKTAKGKVNLQLRFNSPKFTRSFKKLEPYKIFAYEFNPHISLAGNVPMMIPTFDDPYEFNKINSIFYNALAGKLKFGCLIEKIWMSPSITCQASSTVDQNQGLLRKYW